MSKAPHLEEVFSLTFLGYLLKPGKSSPLLRSNINPVFETST